MNAVDWADNRNHWLRQRADRGDREAAAVLTILSQPWCAARVASWIGTGDDAGSIWFNDMLEAGWSSGERVMLELAWHLWNDVEAPKLDLNYLLTGVGDEWLAVALAAMAARHGGPLPILVQP